MVEFYNLDDINIDSSTCVTIGNFDGVHLGHQRLIQKAVDYARANNLKSVVFTFSNHPVNYFKPNTVKSIITEKEKRDIVEKLGVDIFISIPFDIRMTEISAVEYIEKILIGRLNIKHIIIGHDFNFARNREGNGLLLKEVSKEYGFDVEIVEPILFNEKRVSSTDIRTFLSEGKVKEASELLGRNYYIEGEVIHGRQIGRTIGFRTANVSLEKNSAIPGIGIYSGYVYVQDKKYLGAISVGTNPTVNGRSLSLEVHIIDFNKDIYGEVIKIEFVDKLRDEINFSSLEELKKQLVIDVEDVRNQLNL